MRILIASDDQEQARRLGDLLVRNNLEDPAVHVVAPELAADRASRLVPELVVLVLPDNREAGFEALRETCHTVQFAHVLVVGPAVDPKLILAALHEGADEYLDETLLETDLAAALARLRTKRAGPATTREAGRVIAVLAPSGGSGSSTLAANLSTMLAKQHGQCGLIDLRLTAGDLASMLDLRPPHTIADLCDRLARVDQSMFEQFFARHACGVYLLAAPREIADLERVTPKGVRRTLAMARVKFPYVVLDMDNAFSGEQIEALWQADTILLVLRLDYTSVRNVRRVIDSLAEQGIDRQRLRLVVNGYGQSRQLAVKQAEQALGMKIAHYIPYDARRVNDAVNRGVPLVLHRPLTRITRSFRNLALSVNGKSQTS